MPGAPPAPAAGPGGGRRWGIPSAIVGLALFLGCQLVFGLVVVVGWLATGRSGNPPPVMLALATLLPTYVAVLGWQWLVSRRRGQGMRVDYAIRFRWYDVFTGIGSGLLAMGAVLGGTVLVSALTGAEASSAVGTTVLDNARPGPVLYVFAVVVAFVGPVVEELHFRGMWWHALRNRLGPVLTLLITSGIFAVIHLEPVRMVGLLFGALVLGGLRLLTNRLGPPIIAHMLLNTVGAVSLLYEVLSG